MPYCSPPSASPTSPTVPVPSEAAPARNHRRSRSAAMFSDEKGPGAFKPLVNLPRRAKSGDKKPVFSLSDEDEVEGLGLSTGHSPPPTSAKQLVPDEKPRVSVQIPPSPPDEDQQIPFPTTVPFPSLPSPTGATFPRDRAPEQHAHIPRTPSTPIFLSNGKPLKPSLKSSFSSPNIAPFKGFHPRVQSAPSTPSTPKNVHFPEQGGLESVVVFEKTQRPRAVSGNMDDTETETEGYDSSSSFPFPRLPNVQLEINPTVSSPIPAPNPPEYANIHLETLVFPSTAPPSLRGSILVRNIAFCKIVAVRFTLDDWQTTSEVTCKHVVSLPSLPPPFRERENPGVPPSQWDRFSFILRLEDVERKLTERTIYLVARYQVPDQGEWWDNNNGSNYRISFQRSSSPQGSSLASRTTSAPPKLVRPVAPPAPQVHRPPQPFKISTSPVGTAQSSPKSNAPSTKPTSPSPKLQLLNYASPATPPLTPPASAAPLPSPSLPEQPREIIGGQPATAPASFIPWPKSPSAKVDTSDSTYAAFVKQFCFIHSPAPGSSPPKVSPPTENLGGWLGFDKYGSGIRANSPALTSLSGI